MTLDYNYYIILTITIITIGYVDYHKSLDFHRKIMSYRIIFYYSFLIHFDIL